MPEKAFKRPFFFLLLPVFFVFHGYVQYSSAIRVTDVLTLTGIYLLSSVLLFALFSLLLRDNTRAALMTTLLMSFYFFFGAFHDFARRQDLFLHKYVISLPLIIILSILFFFRLRRISRFPRATRFLNTLFLLFIVVDLFMLFTHPGRQQHQPPSSSVSQPQLAPVICADCPRPDIYLLVFDEYSGNQTLSETYHYDNHELDSFLVSQQFRVLSQSRSNYFFTPFSMASIFNMSYLHIREPRHVTAEDYLAVMDPAREAAALRLLAAYGYSIVNNSSFDLPQNPAGAAQTFIPVRTRLITDRTLFHYVSRDIGWWFKALFNSAQTLAEKDAKETDQYNEIVLARAIEESTRTAPRPRFIYTHVFMPHSPYVFDSLMHRRSLQDQTRPVSAEEVRDYLQYIPYTNTRIKQLISAIRQNTRGKAVILFLSDHGYRYPPFVDTNERVFFNNQNAIYLPGGDYQGIGDSLTTVNEFRVLFNTLFRQHLPLQKDSVIFLKDASDGMNKK